MSEEKIYLDIKDLEVVYSQAKKTVRAVNRVSLQLVKGKTLGLVGETGAGKTTIAKSILRILPNPQAKVLGGQIFLDGEDLFKKSEDAMYDVRGTKVAMVFQDPMTALNPLMTVGDQILEVLMLHNDYNNKEGLKKAGEMLETVGIPAERCSEYPHQFSGGMKQRVVIAMALACNPELLLADEPTTALDVTIQAQIVALLRQLRQELGLTILFVTHNLDLMAEICDRAVVLYGGAVMEEASVDDLFTRPRHPYTRLLLRCVPRLTTDGGVLESIEGAPPILGSPVLGCPFHPRCPEKTAICSERPPEETRIDDHRVACWMAGSR